MDQDGGQLRTLLLYISDRLSNDDRVSLCFQIGDDVPRRIRDAIQHDPRASMDPLWEELINRNKISSNNVQYLINHFRSIRRIDLVRRLENYLEEQNRNSSTASSVFTRHEPLN